MRILLALLLLVPTTVPAQAGGVDTLAFNALSWRSLGPLRGGRSVAVAGSVARPNEYYMGTTGGGVFKTSDGGDTWASVSDRYFGGTIGAIAVAPSNPDIVYVGGGEFPIRGNTSHGDGVYKSTDGGKSWAYMGLVETRHISKIRVHPTNPDVAYVAALGPVFGSSPARGIYKTTDGGKSWSRILTRDDNVTGAVDLSMDPSDPEVLYAGLWHAYRKPWQLVSGGPGSGIFKTTNGGRTWTEITRNPGMPSGLIGNIGISVSPVNPKRVYAQIEADEGGVFRSDDGGATWARVNDDRNLRQRAWYYTRIYADPQEENTVYASNVSFQRSRDGGVTWEPIRTPHSDSHDLWIAPNNNRRMVEANDGGANVSADAGRTWTDQDYATAQFYHVTTTNHFPYHVCGAQQDNSTACLPSRVLPGATLPDFYDGGGCESGYMAARPDNPDIIYAGCYGGQLTRKNVRTGTERDISPWPLNPMGASAGDLKYRLQWTFPIVVSPHDPNTLYVGANVLFKSTDDGSSFTAISPDLTRADPRTLGPSGGPITRDQTSVEYYGTIFTVAESPLERGVIWAGSDDGLVHLTRDGGATWTNVTPKGIGEWMRMSIIEASHHAKGTAYLAGNRFQLNDFTPYLYKSTDYGQTWTRITAGIAPSEFARVIREDPVRPGLLYAGTERGVWVSFNDGASWQRLQKNLPPVPVHDLAVKEGDLVAGTHGRAFWLLEDLSVLRQVSPEVMAARAHLFQPRDTYRISGGWGGGGYDVTVQYALKQGGQQVTLEFLDAAGAVVRRFSSDADSAARADSIARATERAGRDAEWRRTADSLSALGVMTAGLMRPADAPPPSTGWRPMPAPRVPNQAGVNRFRWNMRGADAVGFDGMIFWAGGLTGPMVPPGTYAVRMTVGEGSTAQTQTFAIRQDPRSGASLADVQAQYDLLVQIRDKTSEANQAVLTIRGIKAQVTDRLARAGNRGALERLTGPMVTQLSAIEEQVYQVRNRSGQDPLNYPIRLNNQIAALAGVIASAEARPTRQSYEVFELLRGALAAEMGKLDAALGAPLAAVNRELARQGLTPIAAAPGGAR